MNDKIEEVKNTIVGMLNTDEKFHFEMAEFCLQKLDEVHSDHLKAMEEQREACFDAMSVCYVELFDRLLERNSYYGGAILNATIEDKEKEKHFECPECGGHYWGTSFVENGSDIGHCHDQYSVRCKFTWERADDHKYFIEDKDND